MNDKLNVCLERVTISPGAVYDKPINFALLL